VAALLALLAWLLAGILLLLARLLTATLLLLTRLLIWVLALLARILIRIILITHVGISLVSHRRETGPVTVGCKGTSVPLLIF
jgi:hypothetical protein